MIYGYLRVSSDEQEVNAQKIGVEKFAKDLNWTIDTYVTDEGVSGGKNPDKRNLGPLLKLLQKDDVIICSEISRLGRDLYMIMDILHFCMNQGCVIYTVKDKFVLGNDIQSKVLAFAFGLSAEIERQMIRQRTQEGLRLRVNMGVLLGRPIGAKTAEEKGLLHGHREPIIEQYKWGVPILRIAKNFGVHRITIYNALIDWGCYKDEPDGGELRRYRKEKTKQKQRLRQPRYKETGYRVVEIDRDRMRGLILNDLTIPQIVDLFKEYTYEQIYDTILCDEEFNSLYRKHGQLKIKKNKK